MFPELDFSTVTETIKNENNESNSIELGRAFLIRFDGNKATVILENGRPKEATTTKEKVQMYAQMLLRTELDKYMIYRNTDFGMTYFKYKGNRLLPKGFINSELKRELEEKMTKLSVVESITDFNAQIKGSVLHIDFTINLVDNSNISISEVI